VVETPADQGALERTGSYRGMYFVLMGKLSPLDGVGARDIGLQQLQQQGQDLTDALAALGLDQPGFSYLLQLQQLAGTAIASDSCGRT